MNNVQNCKSKAVSNCNDKAVQGKKGAKLEVYAKAGNKSEPHTDHHACTDCASEGQAFAI